MKKKLYILLFAFALISLGVSVYQFNKGITWEAVLSVVYFAVFLIAGLLNRPPAGKGK